MKVQRFSVIAARSLCELCETLNSVVENRRVSLHVVYVERREVWDEYERRCSVEYRALVEEVVEAVEQ